MFNKIFNLTNLTLAVALILSAIAAYYSIAGLIAIFSAAVIPIIIMGTALELSKVVTTVWLHKYWHQVKWSMKLYLVTAVIALAFLTSMGIFGFLSKAHSDQSLVSGDVQSKISLYDEKIRIAKENIDANRRALKQLDEAVDQVMGRSTSEQGAERSVQIRRQQGPERQRLIRDIEAEQKKISGLNEERAPIAAEVRKVEAEVGPIKYIAALIYGDNPDANLLERAVRWVIILIVLVFDPLALTLVLAANSSRRWDKEKPTIVENNFTEPNVELKSDEPKVEEPKEESKQEPIEEKIVDQPKENVEQAYLTKPWVDKVPGIEPVGHQVYTPEVKEVEVINCIKCDQPLEKIKGLGLFCTNKLCDIYTDPMPQPKEIKPDDDLIIVVENVTKPLPYKTLESGYVLVDEKSMSASAAHSMYPEMFRLTADSTNPVGTNFGVKFPQYAQKGDIFVRVDILPNRVFKYDGTKWIEIKKQNTDSYMDTKYLNFLVKELEEGRYDIDLLTDHEKDLIEQHLKKK